MVSSPPGNLAENGVICQETAKKAYDAWQAPDEPGAKAEIFERFLNTVHAIQSSCHFGHHPWRGTTVASCMTLMTLAHSI